MIFQTSPLSRRLAAAGVLVLLTLLISSCQKEEIQKKTESIRSSENFEGNDTGNSGNMVLTDRAANYPKLAVKVFLNGPYVSSTQLMNDNLRSLGLIPATSPYGTGETIGNPSAVFAVTGNNAIVDWVLVQLRTGNTNIVTSASGLLQRDGDVVGTNGVTALSFPGAVENSSYQVAVLHRNHLGCLTTAYFQPSTSTPPLVDLTVSTTPTWQSSSAVGRRANGGKMTLFEGDTKSLVTGSVDKKVIYQGAANDRTNLFSFVMGWPTNPGLANYVVSNVYETYDVNMDGNVIYQGPNNDSAPILFSVLSSPLNTSQSQNFIVYQAIP